MSLHKYLCSFLLGIVLLVVYSSLMAEEDSKGVIESSQNVPGFIWVQGAVRRTGEQHLFFPDNHKMMKGIPTWFQPNIHHGNRDWTGKPFPELGKELLWFGAYCKNETEYAQVMNLIWALDTAYGVDRPPRQFDPKFQGTGFYFLLSREE